MSEQMSWPKFLKLMMSVRAKSVKDKMALFLFVESFFKFN